MYDNFHQNISPAWILPPELCLIPCESNPNHQINSSVERYEAAVWYVLPSPPTSMHNPWAYKRSKISQAACKSRYAATKPSIPISPIVHLSPRILVPTSPMQVSKSEIVHSLLMSWRQLFLPLCFSIRT